MSILGLERGKVERDLIFRSQLLVTLAQYLEDNYVGLMAQNPKGVPPALIIDRAREDQAILEVFLLVLARRLTVIDDLEFKGTRHSNAATPFLSLKQSRFIADLLNRGLAYSIFRNDQALAYFSSSLQLLPNLRQCISRLYERDKRLKLWERDFWVVDKSLAGRVDQVNLEAVSKGIGTTLYENAPQTIPFEVRAALFRAILTREREQR
jgi:hypothetical protein